jgi:SAM-dependent methyltransferase
MMPVCNICQSTESESNYYGSLRKGSFGSMTSKPYHVHFCKTCGVHFIENILPQDYYDTPQYREEYNGTIDVNAFYKEYDINDTNKITKIGLHNFRNKRVADFGTAAGTFLQAIHTIAKTTIAIEPSKYFHETLQKTNDYVFSYGKDLCASGMKINIATSFDVIEHVSSPIVYLKEIYESLQEGGVLYLKTPNFNDILHELLPESYDSFNYRTAHLFYFDKTSLGFALKEAGFTNFEIQYIHDYDISNMLYWMKEKRPTGNGKTKLFDDGFNGMYKNYLEKTGHASHLWVEVYK